ncbi:SDR family NAD(P)-dependent oxidoreductase [Lignipirellula cremea]|uniref:Gluconate 5-dehydrogenase n=1 Tax=Lignipirellula cremea TaxID=2528010 RepID=A0A518E337_9BACT|nr:SDR family oxidoreductase [Lignipirellula cremea]QDU98498.1 Gluconate 5-dehydrogenase [Lignipirellula cremea]
MSILDRFRLDGRRAVITGGTRGLGLAMAQALGEAGAELVVTSRNTENLKQAHQLLSACSPKVEVVQADLATPQGAEIFCSFVLEKLSPIDILINNVGGRRINHPTEEMPLDQWMQIVDLNLNQAFVCTKMIGGAMLPRGYGRVINIASISGLVAGGQMRGRSYETCKAGLAMFTKAVAADWAPHGVTVNAIAPGTFLTDTNRRWFKERPELKTDIESRTPMGRLGEPEEIAGLALYLASDASSYTTGSLMVVDGGRILW